MSLPVRFTGKEKHEITQKTAVQLIVNFRTNFGADHLPGGFIDKAAVMSLLSHPDARGFRYYYGYDRNDTPRLVFAATSAERNDLLEDAPVWVSSADPQLSPEGHYCGTSADHAIPLETAGQYTARYREQADPWQPHGGFFGRAEVLRVLCQNGCVGIRYWFGANEDGTRVIVMSGVDGYGQAMISGLFIEMSSLCPPLCGDLNLLNAGIQSHAEHPARPRFRRKSCACSAA